MGEDPKSSRMSEFTLREGTRDDIQTILNLILELARFEKLEHEVVATPDILAETVFGQNSVAKTIIAETADGTPAGFALYFFNFSTFLGRPGLYLEDLFVLPEYRGTGLGQRLLKHLAGIAVDHKCGRMEWAVLDWNQKAINLYEMMGARPQSEWITYRLTGPALSKLASR